MTEKKGKVWGETSKLLGWGIHEVHYLSIKKNGFCSEHKHANRTNYFFVISGKLLIRVWVDGISHMVDETVLGPGESTMVPLNAWHQFHALEDCRVIESYEMKGASNDIQRRSQGGKE